MSAVDAQKFTDEVPGHSACAVAIAAGKPEGGTATMLDETV